jgi:hypothetical protein
MNIILSRRSKKERKLVRILFMNTRRKLGLNAQTLGAVLNRDAQIDRGEQAVTRGSCLSQAIDCDAEAVARGAVPCASQVLGRFAEAVARGAARCALHVLDRGAQADAQTVACGDAAMSQQEKNTRQMSRRAEKTLPASSEQRQGAPRGDVPSKMLMSSQRGLSDCD